MLLFLLPACWIFELRDPLKCDTGQHELDSACVDDVPPIVIPGDDSGDSSDDSSDSGG